MKKTLAVFSAALILGAAVSAAAPTLTGGMEAYAHCGARQRTACSICGEYDCAGHDAWEDYSGHHHGGHHGHQAHPHRDGICL